MLIMHKVHTAATNVSVSTVYGLDRRFIHTGDLKYHRRALADSNLPNSYSTSSSCFVMV
jgi:hypothetical protein